MSNAPFTYSLSKLTSSLFFPISTNGIFLSINLINGNRNWVVDISGKNTPIISGNQIYLVNNDSKLICLKSGQ